MRNTIVSVLLLLCFGVNAQKKSPAFSSIVQTGLLEGDRGNAFQLKLINGVQYKTWMAGLGAGVDYYHTRSVPLFLHGQKAFGNATTVPFLYADGGYNFLWVKSGEKEANGLKTSGGLYLDAGLGFQTPVAKKSALFFSVGYSRKKFATLEYPSAVAPVYPPEPTQKGRREYNLSRLSIQTGLRF